MKRDDLRAFLAEKPYDAMVLTSEISRRYATGFHSTAGAVYLSAKQAVFFTDFRYVEAAHAAIKDFEVREIKAGQSYSALINELLDEDGAKKVALEDKTLTYAEFMSWSTALHATAVRLEDGVESLRRQSEALVVVTGEVFSGGSAYAGDTGTYLRVLAAANRALAARADAVCEVACGLPRYYKGEGAAL